jgi:putative endonuclease
VAKKDELGRWGEEVAVARLTRLGYDVVDRNWRCPQGELDIVARVRGGTAFVEVKTRTSLAFGHPFEAITSRKLARLHSLALAWCRAHPGRHGRLRVDVVAVTGAQDTEPVVELLEDVF